MKTTMNFKLILFLSVFLFGAGMDATAQRKELTLESSLVCGMCKETIEEGLAYTKGVRSVRVDVDANTVSIVYNEKHIDKAGVKKAINELGYVAGDSKPTREQYERLHECCRADGVCE